MRLLIIEDEIELAETLAEGLRREGYHVQVAHDGRIALSLLATAEVDLVVLDRDLPGLTGDAVCRVLRSQRYPARILMLTAATGIGDRIDGLDLGADDYLGKPFAYLELLARLRALARRVPAAESSPILELGGVRVDTARRIAERDGVPLSVTRKELRLLEVLLAAEGGFVSAEQLLDRVWDDTSERTRGVVKVTVHSLRTKLGHPDPIESAHGHGYRMRVR
jgi:DNA-binding response OmpR family regulator